MAIIDELAIRITAERDPSVKKALDEAAGGLAGVEKTAGKAGSAFGQIRERMGKATGVAGRLIDQVKSLGIVSSITGGIMAAWSVSAGKSAQNLLNVSQATQNNLHDIQQLGSMYEQVGGKAEEFARDAENFFHTYGKKLDLSSLKEFSGYFSGMSESMAQQVGRTLGLSDTFIRLARTSAGELDKMADEAIKKGHVVDQRFIDSAAKMNQSWEGLKTTISSTSMVFQGSFADSMEKVFGRMGNLLAENQGAFERWGRGVGLLVEEIAAKLTGTKSDLDKDWENLRELQTKQGIGEEAKKVYDNYQNRTPLMEQAIRDEERTILNRNKNVNGDTDWDLKAEFGKDRDIDSILKRDDLLFEEKLEMLAVRRALSGAAYTKFAFPELPVPELPEVKPLDSASYDAFLESPRKKATRLALSGASYTKFAFPEMPRLPVPQPPVPQLPEAKPLDLASYDAFLESPRKKATEIPYDGFLESFGPQKIIVEADRPSELEGPRLPPRDREFHAAPPVREMPPGYLPHDAAANAAVGGILIDTLNQTVNVTVPSAEAQDVARSYADALSGALNELSPAADGFAPGYNN